MTESVLKTWKAFVEGAGTYFGDGVRPLILDSWKRSRAAGLPAAPEKTLLSSVDNQDLQKRLARNSCLLAAAKPLLTAFSLSVGGVKHVVYLTDRDGIVLYSVGNAAEMRIQGLLPGYDWSERTMGTNGAGTALATGQPVAVIGPEHYQLPFHEAACLGAPVVDPEGEIVGAIDLSTHVSVANPSQLNDVIQVARQIALKMAASHAATAPVLM